MPSRKNKRKSTLRGTVHRPSKEARADVSPQLASTLDGEAAQPSAAPQSVPSFSPSLSSSASSSSSSSFPSSSRPSCWRTLSIELLLLVANFSSYRQLLPLSSTSRHFYQLIHEEDATGVVRTQNSVVDLPTRISCWTNHPPVRVAVHRDKLRVDGMLFVFERVVGQVPFLSYVLTSLRNLPHLELLYKPYHAGPDAANLYPLRHFTQLRSLVLELAVGRDAQRKVDKCLSTAILSQTSLAGLSVNHTTGAWPDATLQRVVGSARLQHITLDAGQYAQLSTQPTSRKQKQNTDTTASSQQQPYCYPHITSVTWRDREQGSWSPADGWLSTFPNAKLVATGRGIELTASQMKAAFAKVESLHVSVDSLPSEYGVADNIADTSIRCVSLYWDKVITRTKRKNISELLSGTPTITHLSITFGRLPLWFDVDKVDSVFVSQGTGANNDPLCPNLTYLEFTGGPVERDLRFLLTADSPPPFAAKLTHLVLSVAWSDGPVTMALLPSLPAVYPNLQKCHVGLRPPDRGSGRAELMQWQAVVDALRLQLGAVWCDSVDAVCEARLDIAWRRSVGLPAFFGDGVG